MTELLVITALVFIMGCSSHEELPPPDNPFDAGNPNYVSPTAVIVSGPSEGEMINSTAVSIAWEGNESASEYRYNFDSSIWSEWSDATSKTFDYLDEGNHNFEIQARSINGIEQLTAASRSFTVNALEGLTVVVFPYGQTGSAGDTLMYQIIVDEVIDLSAIEYRMIFDNQYLELIDVYNGSIVDEWDGIPLVITEVSDSSVSMTMVSVESDNNAFSGSTSIATIGFRVLPEALMNTSSTIIELNEVVFLNPSHDPIEINIIRSGVFYEN